MHSKKSAVYTCADRRDPRRERRRQLPTLSAALPNNAANSSAHGRKSDDLQAKITLASLLLLEISRAKDGSRSTTYRGQGGPLSDDGVLFPRQLGDATPFFCLHALEKEREGGT